MKKYIPIIILGTALLFTKAILVLFLLSLTFLVLNKFGKLPLIDFDPTPFALGVILIVFNLPFAILYAIITIPIIDLITARLNQWTVINLSALIPALLLSYFLNSNIFILFVSFNIIRFILSSIIGFRKVAVFSTSSNTVSNSLLASLVVPFI